MQCPEKLTISLPVFRTRPKNVEEDETRTQSNGRFQSFYKEFHQPLVSSNGDSSAGGSMNKWQGVSLSGSTRGSNQSIKTAFMAQSYVRPSKFNEDLQVHNNYIDSQDELNQEVHLQKRRRGRPKKRDVILNLNDSKESAIDTQINIDSLNCMAENAHVFNSDTEEQNLVLAPSELKSGTDIKFSEDNYMIEALDNEEREKTYRLDIGKLIRAIEQEHEKSKVKKFVCRFCGKAFEKPSSLGGHTAKTHNGLSLKYKNRLTAAKNRKTERNRIQYLKKAINLNIEA
jgi:hypothetical protein